jgi:pimeloyl-ACP methyl ester carboxylesterase
MPVATRDSVELYFESTGAGAPVLLVMGLGMTATGWWRTVPVLAESLRAIAFDNRGVGRSGRPPGPYSTPEMADDAIAVLDAAGVGAAYVYASPSAA